MRKACLAALAVVCLVPAARASGPISTSIYTPDRRSAGAPTHPRGRRDVGADKCVLGANRARRTSGRFRPANPADPGYNWAAHRRASAAPTVGHGLTPYFTVWDAPLWAQKDEPHQTPIGPYRIASWKPDPAQFGAFARALALRYDGAFSGLPRVRYFEVWDEPNLSLYLSPQIEHGSVVVGDIYRGLLNAFAGLVHAVHQDNVVVADRCQGSAS